ncbi:hypothetical protein [Sphingomonas sp. ID0503]|uniref:hypothetical protein n=1 Tax=Sphingomonas sp. ID0503 TaxID=3399691 RepID=UPI003AFACA29
MRDPKRLGRLLRVREVQRDIAQAQESQARGQLATAEQLVQRIDQLVADQAPSEGFAHALTLAAGAVYRTRLTDSRVNAQGRVFNAERAVEMKVEATKSARRDHNAMEKLVERAKKQLAMQEMRKLSDEMPSGRAGTKLAKEEAGRG